MLNKWGRIKILWVITAALSLVSALWGVINPGIYNNLVAEKYMPGTISQDFVSLLAAVLLLVFAVQIKEKSRKKQIVGLGILGYLFYAYGVYVIEQIYNMLYFFYMGIFSMSFFSIMYSLINIRSEVIKNAAITDKLRKVSVGFSFLIPLVFCPLWVAMLVPLITTGERIQNTYGVFIMDLCFIMPIFVILAIMAAKKQGLGILLLPALFVLGFTLLFPVGFAEVIKGLYGMNLPVDLPSAFMYTGISIIFLVLSVLYLRKIKSSGNITLKM